MARNLPKAIDAIDKSRPPRRHIILQTLPPIVFSTPTSSLTVRFAMTTPIVKSNRVSSSSDVSAALSAVGVQPVFVESLALNEAVGSLQTRISKECASVKEDVRAEVKTLTERLDTRIDGLDTRIDGLETRIDGLDTRMGDVETRLDDLQKSMDTQFATVGRNFKAIDNNFKLVQQQFDAIDDRFDKMNDRFDTLEAQFRSIMSFLQQTHPDASIQIPPGIVKHAPSSDSHDDTARGTVTTSRVHTSSARQPTVAGPSNTSHHALTVDDAAAGEGASLAPSTRQAGKLFREIRRMSSLGISLLKGKGKGRDEDAPQ